MAPRSTWGRMGLINIPVLIECHNNPSIQIQEYRETCKIMEINQNKNISHDGKGLFLLLEETVT